MINTHIAALYLHSQWLDAVDEDVQQNVSCIRLPWISIHFTASTHFWVKWPHSCQTDWSVLERTTSSMSITMQVLGACKAVQNYFPVSGSWMCGSIWCLTYVNSIQHATTVFTKPAFSGFTIQASLLWLLKIDEQMSTFCPGLILHNEFCCLRHHSFGRKKNKNKTTTTKKTKKKIKRKDVWLPGHFVDL